MAHHGDRHRQTYIWGLAAFGQDGVRRELEVVMKQAGTTSISKITKSYIVAHTT